MAHLERVIVLIDMDCFYCQVEEKLDPNLVGKPIAVVQYNQWKGGGIIAVNYPAREKGVTRHMRGDEAKEKCPDIILARVPSIRGKADISKYRDAGNRVAKVLQTFTSLIERASVDEAYLDITESVKKRLTCQMYHIDINNMQNTYVVGYDTKQFIENVNNNEASDNNVKLAMGGLIAEEIRAAVLEKTGYKCSAGIAHNKILAKLVCGLHKPNRQTILPYYSVPVLYENLAITDIKGLGGKFGNTLCKELNITYMSQLAQLSLEQLAQKFDEKTAHWLYNIGKGIDMEPVTLRLISKSIGCCKRFPGRMALTKPEDVEHWTSELSSELSERLVKDKEENNRKAKHIVVSFTRGNVNCSRTVPLHSYAQAKIVQSALDVLKRSCQKPNGSYNITYLGMSVGNFQEVKKETSIVNYFKKQSASRENFTVTAEHIEAGNRLFEEEDCTTIMKSGSVATEEDKDEETANTSVYSASTEELELNADDLIYYEDVCSEFLSSEAMACCSHSPHTESEVKEKPIESFFINYFNNIASFENEKTEDVDPSKDSYKHCSKCHENIRQQELTAHMECHLATEGGSKEEKISSKEIKTLLPQHQILNESNSVLCDICQKRVRLEYFGYHMDYHETKQQTSNVNTVENKSNKAVKKVISKKRKSKEALQPISTFLVKSDLLDDSNSEVCPKCSKRIKLEEIESHKDYHLAKKLHEELNANMNQQQNNSKTAVAIKKIKS